MPFWLAVALLALCMAGGLGAIFLSYQNNENRFVIVAAAAGVLALCLLLYIGVTFVFHDKEQPAPNEIETEVSEIELEARARIDPFIDLAIATIETVRQDELSQVSYAYEKTLAYDGLNAADKAMYDDMLRHTQNLEPFAYTAAEDGYEVMDQSFHVYGALTEDYPDIDNYFFLKEVFEGEVTTAIEALYFMPGDAEMAPAEPEALRHERAVFDAVCERIVTRMPEGLGAYDQYRYLATVISYVTSYDYTGQAGWQDGRAYGSILGGNSICQGYSLGFMVLCQKADLWCEGVEGIITTFEMGEEVRTAHMWNQVKLDSGVYHVDVTWSDELGAPDSPEWEGYFMLTEEEILLDHEITPLP